VRHTALGYISWILVDVGGDPGGIRQGEEEPVAGLSAVTTGPFDPVVFWAPIPAAEDPRNMP